MQSLDSGNLYTISNFVFLKGKWAYPKIIDKGNNIMKFEFVVITEAVVRKIDQGFVCGNMEGQYRCNWDSLGSRGADSLSCCDDCRVGEKLMFKRYILKVEITELTDRLRMEGKGTNGIKNVSFVSTWVNGWMKIKENMSLHGAVSTMRRCFWNMKVELLSRRAVPVWRLGGSNTCI